MKTIYTTNAAYRGKEIVCTDFPGQAVMPTLRKPRSVKIEGLHYNENDQGDDTLRLEFSDGREFTMIGVRLIEHFINDCIGPRNAVTLDEHLQHGVITLGGNRFWAYTNDTNVIAIVGQSVPEKQYTLTEVPLEELV